MFGPKIGEFMRKSAQIFKTLALFIVIVSVVKARSARAESDADRAFVIFETA